MALFAGEFDVGADPFLTPAEFLAMPDMVENGRVVELDDPEVGTTQQIGPLVLLGRSKSTIDRPAPSLDEHADGIWTTARGEGSAATQSRSGDALAPPPLAGVTVVEAAYFVAGPLGSATLAELGARVIKLEPINGDPFRATMTEFAQISHGKESLAIDLKHPRAREIVDRLLSKADVLLHSFRPGVPERLGLDYEHVHALNPRLVYLYAGSYGSKGPQSQRPAFHSTPNALSGAGIAQAGEGNPPVDDSYPDPCSGLGVATALAIGLHARDRTGEGQPMETTMLTATGYVHSDMVVQYEGRPAARIQDAGQHGFDALYRLYQCASGWIFLAAVQQGEWETLAAAVGHDDWLTDERFATAAARAEHDDELTDELSEIFATESADLWQTQLLDRGVPATRADEQTFEEFVVANVPHEPMTHPAFGDYWRRPPGIRFSGCEPVRPSGAPSLGEHTRSVLAELGFTDDEAQDLIAGGAVKAADRAAD
jgi:crotonobetainyl-CoA:carnitine CoA-transferase CaiB-like acyl-CoA transferase